MTSGFPKNNVNDGDQHYTDLKSILAKYFYHWPLFLLFVALAFSAAYYYLEITKPVYEISASILVKDEKKSPQEKSALKELDQSATPNNAEAEIEILKSKTLINKVVNDMQLWTSYETGSGLKSKNLYESKPFKFLLIKKNETLNDEKIQILIKDEQNYEVINPSGSKIPANYNNILKNDFGDWALQPTPSIDRYIGKTITIRLYDPEQISNHYIKDLDAHLLDKSAPTIGLFITDAIPQRGKDFLNNLIKVYNEASSEEIKRTTKNTIDFIDNRLASLSGELDTAEHQVESYRSSQGLTDINSQSKVYLENVQVNDQKLNEVNVQLNVIEGIERYLNSASNSDNTPTTLGVSDPILNSLLEKLSQLQLKRVALLATTPESNPVFEPINRQIKDTKASIRGKIAGIKSSLLSSKRQLQSFNNKFESSIKEIPGQERQFLSMKRQQSIKENLYVYLLQKREELALSYASTLIDARIVDQANVGDVKWPRLPILIALALLCGLGVPFLILYFRYAFNSQITEKREITAVTRAPILGEISYQNLGKSLIVMDNVRHVLGEQIRSLRTNLHYLHAKKDSSIDDGKGKVTLFTSSISKEGKSFVSSNLAVSLAASGKRTVILEMDLRKPKLSSVFNLPSDHKGISDFLSSPIFINEIIRPSGIVDHLDFIGSGYIPNNPSELLESERLNQLIGQLREKYEEVIIDSPPLHLVTDAMIISKVADVSLYVVRQGYTKKVELNFIGDLYDNDKIPNLNIIFNGIKENQYGYGYHYDHSYYSSKSYNTGFKAQLSSFLSRF